MAKDEMPLFTTVDDETYAELNELAGQRVVQIAVWEDALDEALTATTGDPAEQQSFDLDGHTPVRVLRLPDGADLTDTYRRTQCTNTPSNSATPSIN